MAAGTDDYLAKPLTLDRLEVTLRTWLSSKIASDAASLPAAARASESAINLERLAEMLGLDDPAATTERLSVLASNLPNLVQRVAQALAARERSALARAAHAAKSAAGSAVLLSRVMRVQMSQGGERFRVGRIGAQACLVLSHRLGVSPRPHVEGS